ncbi:glycosyl transferase [Geranomyces variabilis]|nr:glycosyl transferase [Geranomyces variabilis]
MLIPSYRSTDFEVHRNWLAITHSLPRDRWYYEDTSEWTLDYPPFFAWFEFALAKVAAWWHPQMLEIDALGYASPAAVLFQRMSVVVMDSVLLFGAVRVTAQVRETRSRLVQIALIVLSPGLLFVDHIHFQYNGFLYGIQLLSIAAMLENRHILGAILFAIVLNFKHIYLYQAPAYFIYLLRAYCFTDSTTRSLSYFSPSRFLALGASTAAVFAASFGPFARHLPQIAARLFPFKRGLCHAYWAPNFWAVYAFVDRVAAFVARRVGFHVEKTASLTRGLVGNAAFSLLPDITPLHTMLLTVLAQLPILTTLWRNPTAPNFISTLTLCGFTAYLFGWHVHEKAILLVLTPLTLTCTWSAHHARIWWVCAFAGTASLLPLMFTPMETGIKVVVMLAWAVFSWFGLFGVLHAPPSRGGEDGVAPAAGAVKGFSWWEGVYVGVGVGVFLYADVVAPFLARGGGGDGSSSSPRYEFLPLMLMSVYCAGAVIYSWIVLYVMGMKQQ